MVVERNRSIDAIKGILIFLVVVGHILLGTLDENIFRYVIYFFHMPAFFFVSGYLLNMERLAKIKYKDVFFKYWKRMLMEWSIAWLIYTIYALHDEFNIMDVIHYIYRPFYHLWFIPALFVMTSALWVTYRIVKDEKVRYILLFSLAFLFYNISNTEFAASPAFSCYLMLFLLIGIFCRMHLAKINISGGGNNNCLYFNDCMYIYVYQLLNVICQNLFRNPYLLSIMPIRYFTYNATWYVPWENTRILGAQFFENISLARDSNHYFKKVIH